MISLATIAFIVLDSLCFMMCVSGMMVEPVETRAALFGGALGLLLVPRVMRLGLAASLRLKLKRACDLLKQGKDDCARSVIGKIHGSEVGSVDRLTRSLLVALMSRRNQDMCVHRESLEQLIKRLESWSCRFRSVVLWAI
jgi:hypothetical protein